MKAIWFLVLLVLFSLTLSHQGHAEEEPNPADWSGSAGLSVPTAGDSGPCAITPSHGHGTKSPACTALEISGTETPSNGSVYTVTGGVGPFTWSASGGTITSSGERTATINLDGTCGSGTITVTDACGSATMVVRYPSGTWKLVSSGCSPYQECVDNGAFCDISFCYCGDFVYEGAIRKQWCRIPAWGPLQCDDGSISVCKLNTYQWVCQ